MRQRGISTVLSRREILGHLGGTAGVVFLNCLPATAKTFTVAGSPQIARSVPLRSRIPTIAIFRASADAFRGSLASLVQRQVEFFVEKIDSLQGSSDRAALIHLGRFPATLRQPVSDSEYDSLAVYIDGPEVYSLAVSAIKHRCLISLECFVRDRSDPSSVVDLGLIINADGHLVFQQSPNASTAQREAADRLFANAKVGRELYRGGPYPTDVGKVLLFAEEAFSESKPNPFAIEAEILVFSSRPQNEISNLDAAQACYAYCVGEQVQLKASRKIITEAGDQRRIIEMVGPFGASCAVPSSIAGITIARPAIQALRDGQVSG